VLATKSDMGVAVGKRRRDVAQRGKGEYEGWVDQETGERNGRPLRLGAVRLPKKAVDQVSHVQEKLRLTN